MKAKKIKSIVSNENISNLVEDILKITNNFKKTKDAKNFVNVFFENLRNMLEEMGIQEKDISKEKFETKILNKLCEIDSRFKEGEYKN